MSDRLKRRIERLRRSGKLPCQTCGSTPGEPVKYELGYFEDHPGEPERIEYCPQCRQIIGGLVRLTW